MRTFAGQRAETKYWVRQGSISQMGMRSAAGFFRRFFRRGVSDRERPAFVAAVFLVGVVESLEKDFLLVRAVLVGLGLWQFRDFRVGHVASGCGGDARESSISARIVG